MKNSYTGEVIFNFEKESPGESVSGCVRLFCVAVIVRLGACVTVRE